MTHKGIKKIKTITLLIITYITYTAANTLLNLQVAGENKKKIIREKILYS